MALLQTWLRKQDKFIDYLYNKGLSDGSIEQYCSQIRKFIKEGNITDDKEEFYGNINAFVSQGNKPFCLFAIRHLLCFLGHKKLWDNYYQYYGKRYKQRKRRMKIKALTFQELKAVRDYLNSPYNIILSIQYETALRISEVLNITPQDIHQDDNGYLEISVTGKGEYQRIVTVTDSPIIEKVISKVSETQEDRRIFTVTTRHYNRVISTASKVMIGKSISSHYIRHSRAVHVWNKTHDVLKVKEILGHRRLETTYTYLKSVGVLTKQITLEVSGRLSESDNNGN